MHFEYPLIGKQWEPIGFTIFLSDTPPAHRRLSQNSTRLQVPFLNLMSNVQARGGSVRVRVGGNTQDWATLEPSLPGGKILTKQAQDTANPVRYRSRLQRVTC